MNKVAALIFFSCAACTGVTQYISSSNSTYSITETHTKHIPGTPYKHWNLPESTTK